MTDTDGDYMPVEREARPTFTYRRIARSRICCECGTENERGCTMVYGFYLEINNSIAYGYGCVDCYRTPDSPIGPPRQLDTTNFTWRPRTRRGKRATAES